MNLVSRINRLEQKRPYDRFAHMTDAELKEAIATITAELETATRMSAVDYLEMLARDDMDLGKPSPFDDPVRACVLGVAEIYD